ncbi:Cysteine-rich secretory protein family protein [Sphingomonas gellani]|uniref:Cysteine-rich secretory protein family protein n=1 Tax=Sphingomonas gellani TaxID=1166340 RepID=A0A1H7YQW3_9SPHN|nr:CAP domain-containing protein [Sphingomonas gellani]SEM47687.1 Cysteine-rich secretory protein family protein [Sphingomonas gellani]
MSKRHLALIAAVLLIACEDAPTRVVEPWPDARPVQRGEPFMQQALLAAHNRARQEVGVQPLSWDDRLAAHALSYAQALARTGRFEHAVQSVGPDQEGENLWTGTHDAYGYDEMINYWSGERAQYVNAAVPAISRAGNWHATAHYSQIVWRGSSRVGCAVASNRTDDFLVCRYWPAGNVVGVRAF